MKLEESNSTRQSSNSISSKDGVLSNRTNSFTRFIPMEYENERRYSTDEKETYRYTRKYNKGQYRNERADEKIGGGENQRSVLLSEARFEQTEEEQKEKITEVKWKTGFATFLVGLLLSAIWFLTRK